MIAARFGAAYTMPKGRVYRTKSRSAQEAHEAIRPTSFARDPRPGRPPGARRGAPLPPHLAARPRQPDEGEGARDDDRRPGRRARTGCGRPRRGRSSTASPPSTRRAATTARTRPSGRCRRSPAATRRRSRRSSPTQHFTEPPPRYTEASLVKALEENGIGRPSTYAATISTIVDRGYVVVRERRLHPEPVAEVVTDLLVDHFGEYVDLAFTARMEEELDEVARGERAWVPLLRGVLRPAPGAGGREAPRAAAGGLHHRGHRTRSARWATRW